MSPAEYEARVLQMAEALHEDCRLEWQAIAVADPGRQVTMHGVDAHYGKAHDLVRRIFGEYSPPSVAAVAEDRPTWAHTAANDPAGLYDDNWEPRTDAGDRDRREAAAPGAAALDRDVIARFLHGEMFDETPEQSLDLDATAYDMADRLIALLGARAAEPKPPESGDA